MAQKYHRIACSASPMALIFFQINIMNCLYQFYKPHVTFSFSSILNIFKLCRSKLTLHETKTVFTTEISLACQMVFKQLLDILSVRNEMQSVRQVMCQLLMWKLCAGALSIGCSVIPHLPVTLCLCVLNYYCIIYYYYYINSICLFCLATACCNICYPLHSYCCMPLVN